MSALVLSQPYLVFLGAATNPLDAKTGFGLRDWCPKDCLGQLRLPGAGVDLGLPDLSVAQARAQGARSLVVGIAPTGGQLQPEWLSVFEQALRAGLDVVSGMHTRLSEVPSLARLAAELGRRLIDVRVPPAGLAVASGKKRSGRRLLTVGTDCACGKKYTALAIHRAMMGAGRNASFRATGQTGILIAGGGIPLDAVVSDFLAGAAEALSPANDVDHWDIVEGQGSLFHPAYAAVTLGLIHGTQPDAMVLCHQPGRTHVDDYPDYVLPALIEAVTAYEQAARLTNPAARVVAISLNTAGLSDADSAQLLSDTHLCVGLPAFDPLRTDLRTFVEQSL